MVGVIGEIWRYPVKSMRGERLAEADVTDAGLPGDRGWALVDRESGKVGSAKLPRLWGRLLECEARLSDGVASITLPDGRVVTAGTDEADAALRELTGRAITLMSRAPAGIELSRYWPDIEGMAQRDQETSAPFAAAAPPGTFFDHSVLHLITTASLAALAAFAPESAIDRRRFRPNLVIETAAGADGFVENGWIGRTLSVGEQVRLRLTDPTPRCVITTLPQGDLGRDIGVLRAIAAHNRPAVPALGDATLPCIGVYATVETPGTVRAGDVVTLA